MDESDIPSLRESCSCSPVLAHDNSRVRWFKDYSGKSLPVATGTYGGLDDSRIKIDGEIYTGDMIETMFQYGKWAPEKALSH